MNSAEEDRLQLLQECESLIRDHYETSLRNMQTGGPDVDYKNEDDEDEVVMCILDCDSAAAKSLEIVHSSDIKGRTSPENNDHVPLHWLRLSKGHFYAFLRATNVSLNGRPFLLATGSRRKTFAVISGAFPDFTTPRPSSGLICVMVGDTGVMAYSLVQPPPRDSSFLRYPGQTVIERCAIKCASVCWILAGVLSVGLFYLFFPITANSFFVGWLAITFIVLGFLPGWALRRELRRGPLSDWIRPGDMGSWPELRPWESPLPSPATASINRAMSSAFGMLIMALVVHHFWIPKPPGAIANSVWTKVVILVVYGGLFNAALVTRLRNELRKH